MPTGIFASFHVPDTLSLISARYEGKIAQFSKNHVVGAYGDTNVKLQAL
jgi:hypothetical protein